jgi:hypothetical protein
MREELNHPYGPDSDLAKLAFSFYDKVPLKKAMSELADRHGSKIAFSPKVEKELEKPVSARLVNVPFDTALEVLANMADLRVSRKGNDFLVTPK